MPTVEELLSDLVKARRNTAILKRDTDAKAAAMATQHESLAAEIKDLKIQVKAAREAAGRYTACACLRDSLIQIADLKRINAELAENNQALKHASGGHRAEAAEHRGRAATAARAQDRHSRDAAKAQADLAAALTDLESERTENTRLRARIAEVTRLARGHAADRDDAAKLRGRVSAMMKTAQGKT
jgi:hypothetical protein